MGKADRSEACKEFEADLVLFHYGELNSTEQDAIETHLRGCASCRRALEEMAKLMPLTVQHDQPPEPFWQDYSRELRKKIDEVAEDRPWWRSLGNWLRPLPLAALGACAVVLLALTLIIGEKYWSMPDSDDDDVIAMMSSRQDLDLLQNMEVLDALDILEEMQPEKDKV